MSTRPDFLKRVTVPREQVTGYDNCLANSQTLSKTIKGFTLEEIQQMMVREYHQKRRGHILQKLYSRFSKMRADKERAELFAINLGKPS